MIKQPTCEERIQEHMESRLVAYCKLRELMDTEKSEEAKKLKWELEDSILAISKATVYKVELSWGGPADWFDVWVEDGEISRIVYHFSDWFDHAQRDLQHSDFEAAEAFLGDYIEII